MLMQAGASSAFYTMGMQRNNMKTSHINRFISAACKTVNGISFLMFKTNQKWNEARLSRNKSRRQT